MPDNHDSFDLTSRRQVLAAALTAASGMLLGGCGKPEDASADSSRVELLKTPDGGVQPQALVDAKGRVHLVFLKGAPSACDVFYVRREPGKQDWSTPLRVNSGAGSAVAVGTIRGAQLALGKGDRIHVIWNGSMEAGKGSSRGMPLLYSRMSASGDAFEPQRNLMQFTSVLDGGGSIAADAAGNVYAAWHGAEREGGGEGARRLWIARSTDDGQTFAREAAIFDDPTGACACCSVKAFVDRKGALIVLYRAATERVNRDMVLLTGSGTRLVGGRIDPWVIGTCPMSSESLVEGSDGVWSAWETDGQIRFGRLDPGTRRLASISSAPGPAAGRKHPSLAVNGGGEVLLAWDEGTGWQKGGALAWQLYDRKGQPLGEKGRLPGAIPVWGLSSGVALPDGRFLIIH